MIQVESVTDYISAISSLCMYRRVFLITSETSPSPSSFSKRNMSLLAELEQSVVELLNDTTAGLNRSKLGINSGDNSASEPLQARLDRCDETIDQLALQTRRLPTGGGERLRVQNRVDSYRRQSESLRQQLEALPDPASRIRIQSDATTHQNDERAALLDDQADRIERVSFKIQDGHRMASESTTVGKSILASLATQRESIQRARSRLHGMDSDVDSSYKLVGNMICQVFQNRVAIYGTLALLFLSMCVAIYMIATSK